MPEISINNTLCIGCRACVLVCPEDVFDLIGDYLATVVYPDRCTGCMICEDECPEEAIKVKKD
ncbi:ferredoxin family protein [Chloroflexota bacterium]